MKTVDFSTYIVVYNFVIGVLVMLASEKLGVYAGHLNKCHQATLSRLTRVSTFTFGACVASLCGMVYIAFHALKIGV